MLDAMPSPADVPVGRENELADLTAALADAESGRGSVHLVVGEPGIGKTRLAQALEGRAGEAGALVLWGRCWESGGAPAYWPWRQVMRSLVDEYGIDAIRRGGGVDLRHLRRVLPDADNDADDDPAVSEEPRFALFDAVSRVLRHAARQRPVLVLLEDLHAGDVASLLLLKLLAQECASHPLVLVGTYRELEARRAPGVLDLLADVAGCGRTVALSGLDESAVTALVRDVAGGEPAAGLVSALLQATNGNPFFLHETLRQLRSDGSLSAARQPVRVPTPAAVELVLQRRVSLLPPEVKSTLEAAAVLGREFRTRLLAQVVASSEVDVRRALAPAVEAGIVREDDGVGQFAFSHALTRDALYDRLDPTRAAALHAAALDALVARAAHPEAFSEAAHHAVKAASVIGVDRAAQVVLRAADQELAALGYEQAAQLYARATELLRERSVRPPLTALLSLATALSASGRIDEARELCLQAADAAREAGDAAALATAALVYGEPGLQGGLVNETLVALLEEALEALPTTDSAVRAKVLARLALELYFSERRERRESLSQEALTISARIADESARAIAVRARFMASWTPDNAEERLALADELKQLARRARDPLAALHAEARRVTCLLELGRVTEVDAAVESHRAMAESAGHALHLWTSRTMLAMRALMEGRLDDTERLATDAYELGWERMRQPNAIFAYFNQVLSIAFERGDARDQLDTLRGLSQSYPRLRALPCLLTVALHEAGQQDEAEARFLESLAAFEGWPRDSNWLHAAGWLAECVWVFQHREAADAVYAALAPYPGRVQLAAMPHPVSFWGSTSRPLALLATVRGDYVRAEEHFEQALAEHRAFGARGYSARTEADYAQMLARRDQPEDRARAAALMQRATVAAASMGLRVAAGGVADTAERADPISARGEDLHRPALRRDGKAWSLRYGTSTVRLRSTRGLEHISHLLARPGEEVLALDLMTPSRREEPATGAGEVGTRSAVADDLGPVLDAAARTAYRRRLAQLREELAEAEQWGSAERADTAQAEIDAIAHELSAALGLGGRARPVGSAAERARIAVTKAIKAAIRHAGEVDPVIGRYLAATIRTGTFCSYVPDPGNTLLGGLFVERS